eukprot:13328310-Alexandrium_andersonii.AAC.1
MERRRLMFTPLSGGASGPVTSKLGMSLKLIPRGATRSILSPGSPFWPRILMSLHWPTLGRTS